MTVLDIDALRAVVQLARAHKQVQEAERARDAAEDRCKELGVTDAQIGAVLGYSRGHVNRRRQARRGVHIDPQESRR